MSASQLSTQLVQWTVQNSGAEHRDYLGMSQIGRCPLELYHQLLKGRAWNAQDHFYCYLGYLFENDIRTRLQGLDPARLGPGRAFSDFNGRFQGHTDGEWDGQLLEIKSVTASRLAPIRAAHRVPIQHYQQSQIYMHYGRYQYATLIYIARDTGVIYVTSLAYRDYLADQLKLKAATILEAVDYQSPPDCECGFCRAAL